MNLLGSRTPVAWLQLSHRPLRLLAAIAGVSFANVLVFFQLGLSGSLYDSQKRPIDQISGQLVLVPKRYTNLGEPLNFSRAQLVRVRGVQGVTGVTPLYIGKADWLNRDTRQSKQALVFGVTPENPALKLPILQQNKALLKQPNTLFFDSASKKAAGSVVQTLATGNSYLTELRGQQAKVVGIFKLGLTFAADINLIMSAANFQTYFPEKSNDDIQLGVIQLSADAKEAQVQATISRFLDPSLQVLTIQQLKEREMSHWQRNTSFGLIFNLGVLVGLAVGAIIVYQILYSDVGDHLSEYATMKAIGYGDNFVVGIILQESLLLATVAFLPSVLLSMLLYQVLVRATGLLVAMTLGRALFVFCLTLVLCSASGWLATGKLRRLDPAEVF
ncbi:FtsX-like permease family protein [Cyanobium sp. BA20m-14]|uniref:ABC transporter permease DevC n=1 Tax=Cyanobium sp. BA20m-14 TaxID=2823703 RepID=UPI0020CC86EB|nr:ABC transporter permease DevC [Cyanobium sp. BA20m-14]MCP9913132.1 FtsX-like permease family protein [Cyanobium sp. BA20m-14]